MSIIKNHSGILLLGTNAERLSYATSDLKPSSFFLETDTTTLYIWDGTIWLNLASVGGVASFIDLDDVPAAYAGEVGKAPYVDDGEDGLVFSYGEPFHWLGAHELPKSTDIDGAWELTLPPFVWSYSYGVAIEIYGNGIASTCVGMNDSLIGVFEDPEVVRWSVFESATNENVPNVLQLWETTAQSVTIQEIIVRQIPQHAIPSHNILSTTHGDTLADNVVAGDVLIGNATPKWARLPVGTQHQLFKMGAALPAWASFDWDDIAAAAAADMVHDHSAAGEGGATLNPTLVEAENFAFIVKNTSGGVAAANDVGYIDAAGEYKTTTTAYADVAWCVVVKGGANGADIYVANRGRVTVVLNGNCSAGDYLYTSTTATQAQPQAYTRAELFAVALTANADGAGGTCSALLLCHSKHVVQTSSNNVVYVALHDTTDFVSVISGAPNATTVIYGAVSAGHENVIDPQANTELGKMILWNTTRGTGRLISDVNVATNTITTVNTVDAWADTDAITIRSQTCDSGGSPYFIDLDLSQTTEIPATARAILLNVGALDAGGAGYYTIVHPWTTYSGPKGLLLYTQSTNIIYRHGEVPLFQRRLCFRASASGTGTASTPLRLAGYIQAVP